MKIVSLIQGNVMDKGRQASTGATGHEMRATAQTPAQGKSNLFEDEN